MEYVFLTTFYGLFMCNRFIAYFSTTKIENVEMIIRCNIEDDGESCYLQFDNEISKFIFQNPLKSRSLKNFKFYQENTVTWYLILIFCGFILHSEFRDLLDLQKFKLCNILLKVVLRDIL